MSSEQAILTRRELRTFGLLFIAFSGLLGGLAWWRAEGLMGVACVLTVMVVVSLIFNRMIPLGRQWTAFSFPVVLVVIGGAVMIGAPSIIVAGVVWTVGFVVGLTILIVEPFGRAFYGGWLIAAEPIGWTVTQLLLAIVYYLVITPIGLIMQLLGRDPMQRRFDPQARSYWVQHDPHSDAGRYFRQF